MAIFVWMRGYNLNQIEVMKQISLLHPGFSCLGGFFNIMCLRPKKYSQFAGYQQQFMNGERQFKTDNNWP